MIMPRHCREVGLKDVDYPLTPDSISESCKGRTVYFRTRYLILRRGEDHSVVEVTSTGDSVMKEVEGVEILSLPEDTIWIDDSEVDVLSPSSLAEVALQHPNKTVIVRGSHDHVSFVKDPYVQTVRVFDVVPPDPPKLVSLVKAALKSQALDFPVRMVEDTVNLGDLARSVETDEIILPCKGEIDTDKVVHYLAKSPEVGDATLIGCEYSKKVAEAIYDRELPFVQMCPRRIVSQDDLPTITTCCELQSGFEVDEDLAVVPWGARVEDVVQALTALLKPPGHVRRNK
jgi:hypothetical protein